MQYDKNKQIAQYVLTYYSICDKINMQDTETDIRHSLSGKGTKEMKTIYLIEKADADKKDLHSPNHHLENEGVIIDEASIFIRLQPEGDPMAYRFEIPLQRLIAGIDFHTYGENFEAEVFCKLENCIPVRIQET